MKRMFSVLALVAGFFIAVQAQQAKVGEAAPDFTLMDSEGKKHSLSDFKGKYVILEWVNFGCPFVRKHYDSGNMQKLQKKYTDKEAVWLSICSSAPGKQGHYKQSDLAGVLKKEKLASTAYLLDEEGTVGKMYDAKTTPHMYVINPDGMLIYAGAIDDKRSTSVADVKDARNYVVEAMKASMNGKEVETKSTTAYGCSVKYK
jgi:peroxiredoxin